MLATIVSGTTIGLEGVLVKVEVDVYRRGFPQFRIVGLPSKAIDESRDRVKTAIKNSGHKFPEGRVIVNLAPADIPKDGSVFDLPIALGILAATGVIPIERLIDCMVFGELSLNGAINPVSGALPIALIGVSKNINRFIIPEENCQEVSLIPKSEVVRSKTLKELISLLTDSQLQILHLNDVAPTKIVLEKPQIDFSSIKGQFMAKRGVEIAISGGHNIQLVGSPGSGKTMIAKAIMGILPKLTQQEMIEVAQIYSVRRDEASKKFILKRPFRNPHHTVSVVGMVGGGGARVVPGEVSLAHCGVLFLDEFPEFPRSIIESLRQPLEDGTIVVTRASGTSKFPARFILVCASNPCPCGYLNHPKKECTCRAQEIAKYAKKLSGPIVDRIDLHIQCPPVESSHIFNNDLAEDSETIHKRVEVVRAKQATRFKNDAIKVNSEMGHLQIKKYCQLSRESENHLKVAIDRYALSVRGYIKVIKIARTIADMSGSDRIDTKHLLEAIQYRVAEPQ